MKYETWNSFPTELKIRLIAHESNSDLLEKIAENEQLPEIKFAITQNEHTPKQLSEKLYIELVSDSKTPKAILLKIARNGDVPEYIKDSLKK